MKTRFSLLMLSILLFIPAAAWAADPAIPFLDIWKKSPHANVASESFTHWDKDGKIPKPCSKCHSGPGLEDFVGADGSAPGVIDKEAPIHAVVDCVTCHNEQTIKLTSVTMPSGVTLDKLGSSARCILCHQGRASGPGVDKALIGKPDDAVDAKVKFINVHYRAAAATLWGGVAKGAYEYAGKDYAGPYKKHAKVSQCTDCHDPHGLKVPVTVCKTCHEDDSDVTYAKSLISDLQGRLLTAIQAQATKTGSPIVYGAHAYPYFFVDKNANGTADKGEAIFPNQYKEWTPRLLRAAYNYQFAMKDPGAFAHNTPYITQILLDSLADLKGDTAGIRRP